MKEVTELLSAIGAILWPVVLLCIAMSYRKPIIEFFERIKKAKIKDVEIETNLKTTVQAAVELAGELEDKVAELQIKLNNGKLYENYKSAFFEAEEYIKSYFKTNKVKGAKVEIRIHAVGMAYSWKYFVGDIPYILRDFPYCHVDLKILFSDGDYLDELNLAKNEEDWVAESKARERDANTFLSEVGSFQDRIALTVKKYRGLPYWHGILINSEHLFIGRTNWHFEHHLPRLSVGKNIYRYFNKQEDKDGRVERFENWHQYYFAHNSTLVCTNQ